jgi:hypothetical protein
MKPYFLISILLLSVNTLIGQNKSLKKVISADTVSTVAQINSPIKSLTLQEYSAYQNGDAMGMTKPAELNNYPAPAKVLAYKKDLRLSNPQIIQLNAAVEALQFKAKEMGRFILQNEKKLNELFSTGKINEGSLIYYSNQIGLYQGELRNAHLQAHLKAKQILTTDQLKKFARLN